MCDSLRQFDKRHLSIPGVWKIETDFRRQPHLLEEVVQLCAGDTRETIQEEQNRH